MEKRLKRFFQNLVTHFSRKDHVTHIYYDGESDPTELKTISPLNILSEELEDELYVWLENYLSENSEPSYYDMYKEIMNEFFDLWVNPSFEELEGFEESEKALYKKTQRMLTVELAANDYEVILGRDLIERLVHLYDESSKLITLTEWLKSVNISDLNNLQYYIVDFEFFTKPVLLTKADLTERLNQSFPLSQVSLFLYFENLIVTQRGFESTEFEEDTKLVFNFYCNIDDYLERNSCEMRETTLRKLLNDAVEPNRPFVEAIIDDLGEIYINHHALHTEKDILDFVNMAYELEEIDREAKTFDRSQIFSRLLTRDVSKNGNMFCHKANSMY